MELIVLVAAIVIIAELGKGSSVGPALYGVTRARTIADGGPLGTYTTYATYDSRSLDSIQADQTPYPLELLDLPTQPYQP
jgi:hypothetical protein